MNTLYCWLTHWSLVRWKILSHHGRKKCRVNVQVCVPFKGTRGTFGLTTKAYYSFNCFSSPPTSTAKSNYTAFDTCYEHMWHLCDAIHKTITAECKSVAKQTILESESVTRLCCCITFETMLFFFSFRSVLPHRTMPGWCCRLTMPDWQQRTSKSSEWSCDGSS